MAVKGENRRVGFFGESRAARYLKADGYKILKRNFRCPFGEVDIIAEKGDVVAFIEVKTRNSDSFGCPNEAVGNVRKRRYIDCARFYFSGRAMDCTVRFDIIEVYRGKINHIISAFGA